MKRYFSALALVISISLAWSCISFKINPILPPENQVEYIHLCKSIDDSGDLLQPLGIQSEFTSLDEHIICFIQLKDIATKIHLRWKWYSPEKKMVRDTGNVAVSQGEKYIEVATAYDMLTLNPEENIEGQWTVVILMNNRFIGKKIFQVMPLKKKLLPAAIENIINKPCPKVTGIHVIARSETTWRSLD